MSGVFAAPWDSATGSSGTASGQGEFVYDEAVLTRRCVERLRTLTARLRYRYASP